ncbi:MAG: hypothetical protein JNK64_27415 [Myxococcales bacterium]|nr:hypothetical protein [Myxococcales bacterium]
MTLTEAQVGQLVQLVVDASGGDGFAVKFVIATAAGAELAQLEAPIEAGAARASWAVDVGTAATPVEVIFTAHLADQHLEAGRLKVLRTMRLGPIGLTAVAVDASVARGALGPVTAGGPPPTPLPGAPGVVEAAPRDSYQVTIELADASGGPCDVAADVELVLERSVSGAPFAAMTTLTMSVRDVPGHQYRASLRLPEEASDPRHVYRLRARFAKAQPAVGVAFDPDEQFSGAV